MRRFLGKSCVGAVLALACWHMVPAHAEEKRPNIVLILADDVGFSDLGAYGSEVSTPNIDALADSGTLFSNYHTSPICAPSRAMLMTGVDSHLAGLGNLPETSPPSHRGQPGYLGYLSPDVVTVASLLRDAGYRTYMTGKWHLGHDDASLPPARGFDRSFALDASGADNWEKRSYIPTYDDAPWFEDGKPAELPEDFYSSKFMVDKTIEYIDSGKESGQPFFSFIAFQAVHIPVQAPREFIEKYEGLYNEGWEALRKARFNSMRARGLLPDGATLADLPAGLSSWDSLSEKERRIHAKSMAINAAMLDAMDFHIGRLITHLKETGEYENTIFLVVSDNGPEPTDPTEKIGFKQWLWSVGYSRDVERLGEKGTYAFIGPEFASASAAPGSFFKFYAGEGGLRVPLIVSGVPLEGAGRADAFSYVKDVAATILDLAEVAPVDEYAGKPVHKVSGRSLLPLMRGEVERVHGEDDAIGIEAAGNAALFRGDYKLMRNMPPLGDGEWRLYDIAKDPGETNNLATDQPERFAAMMAEYEAYTSRVGVLEIPEGYDPVWQIMVDTMKKEAGKKLPLLLLVIALPIALVYGGVRFFRRRKT